MGQGKGVRSCNVTCADGLLRYRYRAVDAPKNLVPISRTEEGSMITIY